MRISLLDSIFFFGRKDFLKEEKEKMRTLLVAALLLSLVASIYSQDTPDPPSAEQLMCITTANQEQLQSILDDCASADLTDVRNYVSIDAIYSNVIIIFPCSCQVSATLRLASTAFQAFIEVAAIMD